jgi:hypothetical protein
LDAPLGLARTPLAGPKEWCVMGRLGRATARLTDLDSQVLGRVAGAARTRGTNRPIDEQWAAALFPSRWRARAYLSWPWWHVVALALAVAAFAANSEALFGVAWLFEMATLSFINFLAWGVPVRRAKLAYESEPDLPLSPRNTYMSATWGLFLRLWTREAKFRAG